MYVEASKCANTVEDSSYTYRMLHLQASIKYESDELIGCKNYIDQCLEDDPDTIVAKGCILYKEGEFELARLKFVESMNALGYQSDLAYNIALCYYKMKM
jgi:tetratricopeptide repeat protein 30